MRKHFDPKLYAENDKACKKHAERLIKLETVGYTVEENEKKRGVDLLLYYKGKHVGYIEVERKKVWSGEFTYKSVQFPERKKKYAELELPTIFLMFNNDFTEYLVVADKDLLNSPLVEVPNKYLYKGEYFFQVPVKSVIFNDLKKAINRSF